MLKLHLFRSTVSWDNLRIPGVLQRLAWSYLVVASLDLLVARGHLDILTAVSQQPHLTLILKLSAKCLLALVTYTNAISTVKSIY